MRHLPAPPRHARRAGFATAFAIAVSAMGAPGRCATPLASNVDFLIGTWSCRSLDNDTVTDERYVRLSDASLEHRERRRGASLESLADRLTYDARSARWTLVPASAVPASPYTGTDWTDARWDLTGALAVAGVTREAHVVYLQISSDAFERETEIRTGDGLLDAGRTDCRRTGATTAAPVAPVAGVTEEPADSARLPQREATAARPVDGAPPALEPIYTLLGTAWSCVNADGSQTRRTYTMRDDASITATDVGAGAGATERERFDWSEARAAWTVVAEDGSFAGSASRWHDGEWVIDGIAVREGRSFSARERYRLLDDSTFRREFYERRADEDRPLRRETCARFAQGAPVFPSAQAAMLERRGSEPPAS